MPSKSETLDLIIRAKALGLSAFKQVDRGLDKINSTAERVRRGVISLQGAIAAYGGYRLAEGFTNTNAEIEKSLVLMEGLTKDAQKANSEFNNLFKQDFVKVFGLKSSTDAFIKFKVSGLDPANGSLQALTDSIAAFGGTRLELERAALGIRQAMGKVTFPAEEMRQQIAEVIPDAYELMANGLKKSVAQLQDDMQKGVLSSREALNALFREMEKAHGGSTARLKKTWNGLFSQLDFWWKDFNRRVGDAGSFSAMKKELNDLLKVVEQLDKQGILDDWAQTISKDIVSGVKGMVSWIKTGYEWVQKTRIAWNLILFGISASAENVIKLTIYLNNLLKTMLEGAQKISPYPIIFGDKIIAQFKDNEKVLREVLQTQIDQTDKYGNKINDIIDDIDGVNSAWTTVLNTLKKVGAEAAKAGAPTKSNIPGPVEKVTPIGGFVGGKFPENAKKYKDQIEAAAKKYKVDPNLMAAIILVESGGYEKAVGPPIASLGGVQAKGLAQFIPSTAEQYGIKGQEFDPAASIEALGQYLQDLLKQFNGDLYKALNAYSGGGGQKYVDAILGKLGLDAGRDRGQDVTERLFKQRLQAAAENAKSIVDTELTKLQGLYDQHLITLQDYYDQRKALIEQQYQAEIQGLRNRAGAEIDPADQEDLLNQAKQKQLDLDRELIQLENEKTLAIKDSAREVANTLRDMRTANMPEITMADQFAKEMEELRDRQADEEQYFRENQLTAIETALDREAALREFYAQQDLARSRLIHDQEQRLLSARLDSAKTVAQGMADAFDSLYELTGQKQKEFFYLSKAAALSQAIINVYEGVTKALAQGGIWGSVMAAAVSAQGAAAIAQIVAQSLAEGGLVMGSSPTSKSDDKIIAATSGEFMQPVRAVSYYGKPFMEAVRNLRVPKSLVEPFVNPSLPSSRPRIGYAEGGAIQPGSGLMTNDSGPGKEGFTANIFNVLDRSEMLRVMSSSDGKNMLLNVMSSETARIKAILGVQ